MPDYNAGRIQPKHTGEWQDQAIHNPLDIVSYKGSSYFCVNRVFGDEPIHPSTGIASDNWKLIAQGIDTSQGGASGSSSSAYIVVIAYAELNDGFTGDEEALPSQIYTGIVTPRLHNGDYIRPLNLGKTHVGYAVISSGSDAPTNVSNYIWEEIPGRIRRSLVSFGSAGTSITGNKALSESINNFSHIDVISRTFSNYEYFSSLLIPVSEFKSKGTFILTTNHFVSLYGGNEGIIVQYVSGSFINLRGVNQATLKEIIGVR